MPSQSTSELKLDNIQLKPHLNSSASWGLLVSLVAASKKKVLTGYLTEYLYLWPYIQEDFFKEVEAESHYKGTCYDILFIQMSWH